MKEAVRDTMIRLLAGSCDSNGSPTIGDDTALDWAIRICREVYGKPCAEMTKSDYLSKKQCEEAGIDPDDYDKRYAKKPWPEGEPGDECDKCDWPRKWHVA